MDQETREILEMLRDGKITPEEAARLLEAIDASQAPPPRPGKAHTLRIKVTDTKTGRSRVNVAIPLGLVEIASKMGLTLGVKHAPELADVDFDEIMQAIKSGAAGQIVDIEDEHEGQHVVVTLD
jgi:hypothetical protein